MASMTRACAEPGCPEPAIRSKWCEAHQPPPHVSRNRAFYNTKAWRDVRLHYIGNHPGCEWPGCREPATQVDHVVPIHLGGSRFGSVNLQSLCDVHHAIKTYQIDSLIQPAATPEVVRGIIAASKWARTNDEP